MHRLPPSWSVGRKIMCSSRWGSVRADRPKLWACRDCTGTTGSVLAQWILTTAPGRILAKNPLAQQQQHYSNIACCTRGLHVFLWRSLNLKYNLVPPDRGCFNCPINKTLNINCSDAKDVKRNVNMNCQNFNIPVTVRYFTSYTHAFWWNCTRFWRGGPSLS